MKSSFVWEKIVKAPEFLKEQVMIQYIKGVSKVEQNQCYAHTIDKIVLNIQSILKYGMLFDYCDSLQNSDYTGYKT